MSVFNHVVFNIGAFFKAVRMGSSTHVACNGAYTRDDVMKKVATLSVLMASLAAAAPSVAGVYMGTNASMPETMQPVGCDEKSGWPCQTPADVMPGKRANMFKVTVYEGSLKANVDRIVKAGRWKKLVWKLPYDYQWVGKADFTGDSVETVIAQLLKHYPLQAVFYKANQVVEIVPRYQYNV